MHFPADDVGGHISHSSIVLVEPCDWILADGMWVGVMCSVSILCQKTPCISHHVLSLKGIWRLMLWWKEPLSVTAKTRAKKYTPTLGPLPPVTVVESEQLNFTAFKWDLVFLLRTAEQLSLINTIIQLLSIGLFLLGLSCIHWYCPTWKYPFLGLGVSSSPFLCSLFKEQLCMSSSLEGSTSFLSH